MKRLLLAIVLIVGLLMPVALGALQETPMSSLEITGTNPTDLPLLRVRTNVYDSVGQPVPGLGVSDFSVSGALADHASIISVTSIEDEALPVATVLVIDVSSSMAGQPFAQAQEAARTFVNSISDNHSVTLITFSNSVNVIVEQTTDKDVLLSAIDNLGYGGQTALYSAALVGVNYADTAGTPRRTVILLGDGAQYDTVNATPPTAREAALEEALIQGVPVYTVGLGWGADRSYLEELAQRTNAKFYESPTPEELTQIYADISSLLRTEYEVLINVDVPADGTEHTLTLNANTSEGVATGIGTFRAPVPVPVIRLPELPEGPITSVIEITPEIVADDGIKEVEYLLDGESIGIFDTAPYTYALSPQGYLPGIYDFTVRATDEDGDIGEITQTIEIGALASSIDIIPPLLITDYTEAVTHILNIEGQTPPTEITIQLDNVGPIPLNSNNSFTIDAPNLSAGEHKLTVTVINEGGVSSSRQSDITIADIAPQFSIQGLPEGALEAPTEISVGIDSSQASVRDVRFEINGTPLETGDSPVGVIVLDPAALPIGDNTFGVTVENEAGQVSSLEVPLTVAALTPHISITGLELGETLEENRTITLESASQTPLSAAVFFIDGEAVTPTDTVTESYTIDVAALSAGPHVLRVEVANESGQQAEVETAFTIGEGPALTLTAAFVPSETPTATPNLTATALAVIEATSTITSQQTAEAVSTSEAFALLEQATVDAQATAELVGTVSAEATALAQEEATSSALALVNAEETAVALALTSEVEAVTATAEAILQSTEDAARASADATATAEADAIAALTQVAEATLEVEATLSAENSAAATSEAYSVIVVTQVAASTEVIQATAYAQATVDTRATAEHQFIFDQQATVDALATMELQQLLDAQATIDAQLTSEAQYVNDIQATVDAVVTLTSVAATQTWEASQPTATTTQTPTPAPTDEATEEATEEVTAVVPEASATAPVDDGNQADATITPIGTLIPQTIESESGSQSILPVVMAILIVMVILFLIFFLLNRGRRNNRR